MFIIITFSCFADKRSETYKLVMDKTANERQNLDFKPF